ncbi:MAG: DEAD/DEAH box helicase, partial [Cyclobacteriaceae bacterium]
MNFNDFGFADEVLDAIHSIGYETPTPIQEQAIPAILDGDDVIGSAQTGTGKTAAFLLPIIDKIINSNIQDKIQALIIVPTRELAVQITQQMDGFSYFTPISSIAVYGGGDASLFAQEKTALTHGVDLIVGTPGRLISHLNMSYVDMSHLNTLILDEADRMLDMGFHDDIMKIINLLPKKRQNLLFSATMPPKIRELAR